MLCDRCKKRNASVWYKQTINGVSEQVALCAECASEVSVGGFFDDGFNFFGNLFSAQKGKGVEEKVCDLCGSTFDDITREGKVGCARCYGIFGDRLRPMIERIHGNSRHVGRKPPQMRDKKQDELSALKKQLAAAIEKEDFESAAKLRDKIREMEA